MSHDFISAYELVYPGAGSPIAATRLPFPSRGARRIRGASFDVSDTNKEAILNFKFAHYVCLAGEICPKTGRPHFQFYMVCKNPVRLSSLRSAIKEAGFQECHASHKANILYVLKQRDEDYEAHQDEQDYQGNATTFQERGTRPDEARQAARTLDCLKTCQDFFLGTQNHLPDFLRQQYFDKISDVTNALCDLMDTCDFAESDDDDMDDMDDIEPSSKKMKLM